MIIASNSEIEVDGLQLMAGYAEEVWTIKRKSGGTSNFVDVDYHATLGLPTTRYWFDAAGQVVLPMGDLGRALVDGGVVGSGIVVMQVTDEATQSVLNVTTSVLVGIMPVVGQASFPPRRVISAGASVFYVPFSGHPLTAETYTPEMSNDGVTWTADSPITTDDYREGTVQLPYNSVRFVRLIKSGQVVWQSQRRDDWCGDTVLLQWTSDSGKPKTWVFECLSLEREVTDTQTTEGVGVLRSTFFPTRKNWKLKATIKVSDLAVDETWYFDDLVTGEVTQALVYPYISMSYVSVYGNSPVAAVVTDKKITRSLTAQTTDLTFKLDVLQVRNF